MSPAIVFIYWGIAAVASGIAYHLSGWRAALAILFGFTQSAAALAGRTATGFTRDHAPRIARAMAHIGAAAGMISTAV